MAAEVMLIGVAKMALEQGVKFLYEQAGEILTAWHARRKNPAAPPPVIVPTPEQLTVGTPHPSTETPDSDTVLALQDLQEEAKRITKGELAADDPAVRATIAALRDVVEAALGAPITFAGEATRTVRVRDVNVVVKDVRGRLTAVWLDTAQSVDVRNVNVEAGDIEAEADVAAVRVGSSGGRRATEPKKPERPIKILFLAANPIDTEPLRLDEEMRAIDRALREAEFRDRFEIEQQWAVRIGDLQEALLRHRPDIVHFSGHGTESSEIVLEDESGVGQGVRPEALSGLFSALRDNIRCVVLNACYSEEQAQGIAEHIDCVVGMTQAVGDAAAIQFATGFYRAIGYGRDVQAAFDLGKNLIDLQSLPDADVPHLVAKKVKAKDVFLVTST